jgi:hypothetical protein
VRHALFGDKNTSPRGVTLWREIGNDDKWKITFDGNEPMYNGFHSTVLPCVCFYVNGLVQERLDVPIHALLSIARTF